MLKLRRLCWLLASTLALAATTTLSPPIAAQDAPQQSDRKAVWYFEQSDVPVDQGFTFGRLDNGMRYILRRNATPEGTAMVRMRIDSGSLDETDTERGLSHFLEHMAFNGSQAIPEGEMIKLLEREGLAFGADTNASTGFEAITYMLNLPRNDEKLLDTALMLMRETASELTIAPDAVDRERGVVLAERRDRANFAQRAQEDNFRFIAPGARFVDRLPIGTLEVLETGTADDVRGLYERTYTPANTVLVIVGDYPVAVMEAAIRTTFADWSSGAAPVDPETGPIDVTRRGLTDIYLDPSLEEAVTISVTAPWTDRPDTLANRRQNLMRSIGYNIIGRRLTRLARGVDAPFKSAEFGAGDIFEDARSYTVSISSEDQQWRKGVVAAVREVNQAVSFGFTQAEVDEQLANARTGLENAVAGAQTRSNAAFVGSALNLVANDIVPVTPEAALALFEGYAAGVTPASVIEALRADLVALENPLIRFQGRTSPDGGEAGLRLAFDEAMALPIAAPDDSTATQFAYTDFGTPGIVVSETVEPALGIRQITFANGVRLNMKKTDVRRDRINVRVALDGGDLMLTKDEPLAVYLAGSMPAGGLGQHSQDELSTVLAGRSVSFGFGSATDSFTMGAATTPRDLQLQMQLIAALLTDPGYRPEGVERFRKGIDDFFESLNSTPDRALNAVLGAELSDGDPRFSLQSKAAFKALDFAGLKTNITDRLTRGAIEVALVGDLDEDAAIAAVASTLGALPPRETGFLPREQSRIRTFTQDRSTRTILHDGEADQALLRMVWPARDDSDQAESVKLQLLGRVLRLELTDRIREQLGQAYSPGASIALSDDYRDYGTITINVSVDVGQVDAAREAIATMLVDLAADGITPDLVERARKPLLEAYENALKDLGGWTSLAQRAQSHPERIERFVAYPQVLGAVSVDDLRAAAQTYLVPQGAATFVVLPSEKALAKAATPALAGPEPAEARGVYTAEEAGSQTQ